MTPTADPGTLALELVAQTLDEIAIAIRHEINVRECAHESPESIDGLRWCLDLVEDA